MTATVLAVVAACTAGTAAAATNEELCHRHIGSMAGKLMRSYHTSVDRCAAFGRWDACRFVDPLVEKAERKVVKKITGSSSSCSRAVVQDGVPISEFGPGGACPTSWAGCDERVPSIDDTNELARCLLCTQEGLDLRYRVELDFPIQSPDANESACIRNVSRQAMKAVRVGVKGVVRCAKATGGAPFTCPVDDAPSSKLDRMLVKLDQKIDKCRDSAGTVAALSGTSAALCRRPIFDLDDLKSCTREAARCMACQASNQLYGQAEDCVAFSGDRRCTGTFSAAAGHFYVTNEGSGSVTYYDADGNHAFGTLAASTFVTGSGPRAVAVNPIVNVVYVANTGDDSVTYLDATTGAPLGGNLLTATVAVGAGPAALSVDLRSGILYVGNAGDDSVTYLDAVTPAPLYGTLPASTFAVGQNPGNMAVSPEKGTLYVVNRDDDTVTYLDAVTGAYQLGTLAASTFPTDGDGALAAVAIDDDVLGTLTVFHEGDSTTTVLDLEDGTLLTSPAAYIAGADGAVDAVAETGAVYTANASTDTLGAERERFATGSQPSALAVRSGVIEIARTTPNNGSARLLAIDETRDILYVSLIDGLNSSTKLLRLDARSGEPLSGTFEESSTELRRTNLVQESAVGVAANEANGLVYATDCNTNAVAYLDGATGEFINGNFGNSSFTVGACPRFLAVDPTRNLLYVANEDGGSVTILDATTGAYANGTLASSTVTTGVQPRAIAVNPSANRVYVANVYADSVTYLVADDGAYINGTFAASSFFVDGPDDFALDLVNDRLLVAHTSGISALDPATGAYVGGTLEDSRLVHAFLQVEDMAVDPTDEVLFWVDDNERLWLHDLTTGDFLSGDERTSVLVLDHSPDELVASPTRRILYTSRGFVSLLDMSADALASGGRDVVHVVERAAETVSRVVPENGGFGSRVNLETDDVRGITYSPVEDVAYINTRDEPGLIMIDGATGEFLNGSLAASSVDIGAENVGMAIAPTLGIVYVGKSDMPATVVYLDATTGTYLYGTEAASSFDVGWYPERLAVNESASILYAVDYSTDTVQYLDAVTGAYVNGTLPASRFAVQPDAGSIAVNESAGLVYVAGGEFGTYGVTYLDATTGAYLNGTLANSTFALGESPSLSFVDETAGILYVGHENYVGSGDTVTLFDAATGAYVNGTLAASTFPLLGGPRALTDDPSPVLLTGGNEGIGYYDAATLQPLFFGSEVASVHELEGARSGPTAVSNGHRLIYTFVFDGLRGDVVTLDLDRPIYANPGKVRTLGTISTDPAPSDVAIVPALTLP